jgi:ADP-ribosylglycohydrolase
MKRLKVLAAGMCLSTLALTSCGGSDPGSETAPISSARTLTAEEYLDKVHGGWLGSAIGGAFGMHFQRMHRNDIKRYLTEAGQWPLTDYIQTMPPREVRVPPPNAEPGGAVAYTADEWGPPGFGPDDDSLFQVANLLMLEEQGFDISSQDIADNWLAKFSVFEASNVGRAVRNTEQRLRDGVRPPESGVHDRGEMMGGQMKGEFWGYLLPGNPEAAAEYGRMDAEVAFFGDGIHGEMFMAAVTAEAFFESDPVKLIEAGLAVIPADSDYAESMRDVMAWHAQWPDDWEMTHEQIDIKWAPEADKGRSVFPNNAVIALALLYGDGDFDKAISIATMAGWDTDTNTADVGPVMGIILGASSIAEKWTAPIANVMRTDVRGAEELQIDDLSRRTVEIGMTMTSAKSAGRVEITN